MSELRELYQEVILDHNKSPHNFGDLDEASHEADGYNPLCGDKVRLQLKVENDTVTEVSFSGAGCAISTASASMLTDSVKGQPLDVVRALMGAFGRLVRGEATPEDDEQLGKLAVFAGVQEFPTRVKCATLCWHTLSSALSGASTGSESQVSTE